MKLDKWKLGDLFYLQMGKTPSRKNDTYWHNGEYSWASISDLTNCNGYLSYTKEKISKAGVKQSGIKITPAGTVMMSFKLTVGKTAIAAEDIYTNEAIMSFIDKKVTQIDPKFFYHMLGAINWSDGQNRAAKGITLNKQILDAQEIYLPPISIQRRIAAILDKADAICRKRKECIKMLDELVKARFVEMFGDINKNSHGFQSALGKELFIFSSGKFLPSSKRLVSGIPVYGGNGKVWYTDTHLVDYPTIIIGRVGAYCGNINLVTEPVWITDNAIYIKELKKQCFDLNFLYYLMYFLNFNKYADYSGQPKITQDPLNNINYIIPPLEIQKLFSDFTKQVEYAKSTMQAQLQEAETLKAALMQQYFSQPSQEKICA